MTKNIQDDINNLLDKPIRIFQKFHDKTKIKKLPKKEIDTGKWPKEWKQTYYKEYPRLQRIILPEPFPPPDSLGESLMKRASFRRFSHKSISIDALSSLLYFTAGEKQHKKTSRFYPSAGGRFPLEVYVTALKTDLPKGLYHYNVKHHSLEMLLSFSSFSFSSYFNQDWIRNVSLLLIVTAVFERTVIKYGDRGYRNILLETGTLSQNLYLISTALNLGVCQIGGFHDDKLHKLLDIDGIHEAVISIMAVGTK